MLALEAVGIGKKALELAIEYAKTRMQFGKPIGVYQAVSHPLADTYVETELARSLAYWAAWCVAEQRRAGRRRRRGREGVLRATRPSPRASVRSRCTAASASPGSTCCTSTTSARSRSRRYGGYSRVAPRASSPSYLLG